MSSKTSSKVKSSNPEPTVLIALSPSMLDSLHLDAYELREWGRVASGALEVNSEMAHLPASEKDLKVMVLSSLRLGRRRPVAGSEQLPPEGEPDSHNLLSAEAMASRMNCTRANVYDREKRGNLFSVLPPARENGRKYPAFQLHPNLDTVLLGEMISLYRTHQVSTNLLWDFLRTVQAAFGGVTGVELLTREQPNRRDVDQRRLRALYELEPQARRGFVKDYALEDLHQASA
jgi:hypothetical protein